jgi:hypothetical protein
MRWKINYPCDLRIVALPLYQFFQAPPSKSPGKLLAKTKKAAEATFYIVENPAPPAGLEPATL